MQHRTVQVPFPSLSSPWAPRRGCQVSKPFWCSQVTFSSTSLHPLHHELPALLYRQTLPFPSSHVPLDQGWGMQCWHRPCAGMGTLATPQRDVNCRCLQGGFFTSGLHPLEK